MFLACIHTMLCSRLSRGIRGVFLSAGINSHTNSAPEKPMRWTPGMQARHPSSRGLSEPSRARPSCAPGKPRAGSRWLRGRPDRQTAVPSSRRRADERAAQPQTCPSAQGAHCTLGLQHTLSSSPGHPPPPQLRGPRLIFRTRTRCLKKEQCHHPKK